MPERKTRTNKILIAILFAALALAPTAGRAATPSFRIFFDHFDDDNGSGLIDCGETFTLQVLLVDDTPAVSPITPSTGTITIPTNVFGVHWAYTPGSLLLDSTLTENCSITSVLEGNSFSDDQAIFTYQCVGESNPGGHSYVLSVLIEGKYVGFSGAFQVFAEDRLNGGGILTDTLTGSNVTGCVPVDLTLSKTDGGLSVFPGQTVAYVLSYGSLGGPASNCSLRETVPANSTFNPSAASPGWSCSPSNSAGSQCTFALGNLPAGAAGSKTFAVDVLATTTAVNLANTAIIATDSTDVTPGNNTASDTTPINPGLPDLALTKSVTAGGGVPGSTVVFRLDVANLGTGLAANSNAQETLPPHSTFNAALSSPGWTCAGANCTNPLGTLIAGANRALSFAVNVDSPLPFGYNALANTACASTSTPNDPPANNCGSASVPLDAAPSVSITKSLASGTGAPGATLTFALTATNSGNRDSSTLTFRETVPAHTTFSAALSPGWVCPTPVAGSACTYQRPGIPGGGGSATVTFSVTVDNPLPSGVLKITNSACIATSGSPDDCDSIDVPTNGSPMLNIIKRVTSGAAIPGQVLTYTLTVQNTGNQGSGLIQLEEEVPSHTTFDSEASSPGWACAATTAGSDCHLAVGTLAGGGATLSRTFSVRMDSPLPAGVTEIGNTACATSGGQPPVCDTVTVPTQASPELAILKAAAEATAEPGQALTYTIAVSNNGDQDAVNVVVTDPLPSFTTFDAALNNAAWACSSSTCSATLATLDAGETVTLTLNLRVAATIPEDAAALLNTACATDDPMRRVCSSVLTPLGGAPDLQIQKTYIGPPLSPGADLSFHLALSNGGTRDASGVQLREIIPPASSFQPLGSDPRWSCSSTTPGSACVLVLSLPAGASDSATFVLRADDPLPEGLRQISNSACLLIAVGDLVTCDDTSTPLPIRVTATLTDSQPGNFDRNGNDKLDAGETLHYRLVVTNPSAQAALNLRVATELDEHLALVTGTVLTTDGTVSSGNQPTDSVPTVTLPDLAPGGSVTIEFDALALPTVAGLASIQSQGTITGPEIEPARTDDPDTDAPLDPTATPLGDGGAEVHTIPTLGQIGLAVLAILLACAALPLLRRRRASIP
jgi:large repetitive protein